MLKPILISSLLGCSLPFCIPAEISAAAPVSEANADMAVSADSFAKGFHAGKGTFLLDGKPFVVKAAELHYPRIPREYWDHRIKMCKALGMNTICLYVFWNAHESLPDQFDFTGQNDLAEFIRLCDRNDVKVILRPGPYVCAEWEMGGLPWWLLQKEDIRLRENDPYFLERVEKFQKRVADEVKGLTIADGGPIIMVQVENEYGSYGIDKEYIGNIRDMLRRNFGEDVTLFQCDWSSNFLDNGLDDLIWTLNFGTGADIDAQFAPLRDARPDSPLMCSEYWSGWFDKWGASHETRPADEMIAGISEMLSKGISFSLYMTHGGTNWGHWAGANSPGYSPDVTSYDYDAPINEQGAPTPKYLLLRDAMAKFTDDGKPLPDLPEPIPTGTVPQFSFDAVAPLFYNENLQEPQSDVDIHPMEYYGQGFGSILYRTFLKDDVADGSILEVSDPHDFAMVYADGRLIGTIDRRDGERTLSLPSIPQGALLDILVEATGRINFGRSIKDYKGITDGVRILPKDSVFNSSSSVELKDWWVYNLHDTDEYYSSMEFFPLGAYNPEDGQRYPAGAYEAVFEVDEPADTFLSFESWGKGLVYVNGHALGRFWEIGPQQTLYMPGCWLRKGENKIMVYDILGPRDPKVVGLAEPIIDRVNLSKEGKDAKSDAMDMTGFKVVADGAFDRGNGWKNVEFEGPVSGRYLSLEIEDAADGSDAVAVAELYLVGEDGKRLSRESWTVAYVDSQDSQAGNYSADKVFDLQESTYWRTCPTDTFPHRLIINLGENIVATGLQYLPRMEAGAPESVKNYRISFK